MKAIAPRDVVTTNLIHVSALVHTDQGAAIDIAERHVAAFETHIRPISHTTGDEIPHYLMLSIDGHVLACEFYEGDAVQLAIQAQINAAMPQTFAVEAFAQTQVPQHLNARVFEHTGADSFLAIIA